MTVNPPKALIALASLFVIAGLMIVDAISTDAGTGLLGLIVGYSTGNGLAARSNKPVEPIIMRKD